MSFPHLDEYAARKIAQMCEIRITEGLSLTMEDAITETLLTFQDVWPPNRPTRVDG